MLDNYRIRENLNEREGRGERGEGEIKGGVGETERSERNHFTFL